jgi:hypothetical protein
MATTPSLSDSIDAEACESFEEAWKSGGKVPAIKDYLRFPRTTPATCPRCCSS